jgi:hypothetical protein
MNPRVLLSLLPAAIFWVLWRTTETWVAISGGFLASVVVMQHNRSQRLITLLTVFGMAIVACSAVIGIVWDSPKAYLAGGPVGDFLFVPLYLASIAMHRPLVGGISRELFPAIAGRIPLDHRVFVLWSLAWAAMNLVQGLVRSWMLAELSVGEYLVWSRVVFWPVSAVMLLGSGAMIYRESLRHPAGRRHVEGEGEPVPA